MRVFTFFQAATYIYKILSPKLRRMLWSAVSISIVVACFELLIALAVSLLGVALATPESVIDLAPMRLLDYTFPFLSLYIQDQRSLLVCVLFFLVASLLCKLGFSQYLYWKQGRFAEKVSSEMGRKIFEGYLYSPYLWHVKQDISVLQTHLSWRSYISIFMLQILLFATYFFISILLLISVLVVSPLIGSFVVIVTGLSAVLIFKSVRKKVHSVNEKIGFVNIKICRSVLTALQGIREVLIYQQQKTFISDFDSQCQKLCRFRPQQEMLLPLPSLLLELVGMVMLLLTVLYMNFASVSLAYMTATITLMAAVAWRLLPTINRFISCLLQTQAALPYIQPVLDRMCEMEQISDRGVANPESCRLTSMLSLDNVSFRYQGASQGGRVVIDNISLVLPKGKRIGLIGLSGSGKSTLVGMVAGLYPPTDGKVSIDGRELTVPLRAGWMGNVGYVPQATFLLNATIEQNVAFSQWGGKIDRERVLDSCRMAFMDFLDDLPQGVDTIVGERGIRLSGGQVQRISIARALYKNPDMLIFDEATSAMDGASEYEIMRTIYGLKKSITVLIVAHRLSTVELCDYIYWIHDGKVHMCGLSVDVLPRYEAFLQSVCQS